jgi:hypothetical protein
MYNITSSGNFVDRYRIYGDSLIINGDLAVVFMFTVYVSETDRGVVKHLLYEYSV